jgi:hypothetical protein
MKGLRGFISICLTVCLLLSGNSNVVTNAQINVDTNTQTLDENESYLSEFTDEQLVHAIADYPYLVDIYAYGSMEEGLQIFSEYCSAYSELLKRDNGYEAFVKYGNELVASYKNNPREDGRTDFVSMAILDIIDTLSIEQTDMSETPVAIHVFSQEDMIVTPAINEYDFATAQETGTIKKLQGMLPGAAEGTWYIVETDGIEYYYGTDDTSEEATLFGYSIISDQYSLANGITVGMTNGIMTEKIITGKISLIISCLPILISEPMIPCRVMWGCL